MTSSLQELVNNPDQWPTACRDLLKLFIGAPLGNGISRHVAPLTLPFKTEKKYVIKFEGSGDMFQNAMEWRVWKAVEDTKLDKWFAPCLAISTNGLWLIQERVTFPAKKNYPKTLPDFFGDTQYANYGKIGNRWVACDYGHPSISRMMHFRQRPARVVWSGGYDSNGEPR